MTKCRAVLNLAGEHFECDLEIGKDGTHYKLAHQAPGSEAIWLGHDEMNRYDLLDQLYRE